MKFTRMTGTATTSVTAALFGTPRHWGSERRCAPLMSEYDGTTVPATGRTTDWFATDRAAAPITTTSKPTTTKPTVQNAPTVHTAAVNVAIVPGPRSWSPPV